MEDKQHYQEEEAKEEKGRGDKLHYQKENDEERRGEKETTFKKKKRMKIQ